MTRLSDAAKARLLAEYERNYQSTWSLNDSMISEMVKKIPNIREQLNDQDEPVLEPSSGQITRLANMIYDHLHFRPQRDITPRDIHEVLLCYREKYGAWCQMTTLDIVKMTTDAVKLGINTRDELAEILHRGYLPPHPVVDDKDPRFHNLLHLAHCLLDQEADPVAFLARFMAENVEPERISKLARKVLNEYDVDREEEDYVAEVLRSLKSLVLKKPSAG